MRKGLIYFVVYIVFGAYFINAGLSYWVIPDFLNKANTWIMFVGGILLVIAGLFSFKVTRRRA
ncbi:MAG: hypothetical protein KC516_00245 [Nanoarchaeota archaeon]|nr:hypothetical protein [Nanoarchaeota archaeon]